MQGDTEFPRIADVDYNNSSPGTEAVSQDDFAVLWAIHNAVTRKRHTLEPLGNSTHMETDRHAELGTILKLARAEEKPGMLIRIMIDSRYPMTVALGKKLSSELNVQPTIVKSEYESSDEEMEFCLDTIAALGFE